MKPLILTCIAIICLLACSSTQPEPKKGTVRLQIVTRAPQISIGWFRMPDSTKFMSGSFQVEYIYTGILTYQNIPEGQYLLKLRGVNTLPNRLDTLINFNGKDMIYLLRF